MTEKVQNHEDILESIYRSQENEKAESRGRLKIFFGYATGVGKTYSMLKAAQEAKAQGIDVVVGYIEQSSGAETVALVKGLEVLPTLVVNHSGKNFREFDIDGAIRRKPQLILIDELAHTNAEGCRHKKRYKDIEELLRAGIDVYTTVNVQHIESLNDMVASITEVFVRERIPDSLFDEAEQVELVDIEPQELIARLQGAGIADKTSSNKSSLNKYSLNKSSLNKSAEKFLTVEKLTALREIALRRCADRVNIRTENARIKSNGNYHTDEHILVCLSSSPSNAKIIRTAARMAGAFKGAFTALFVETPDYETLDSENAKRLAANMRLAEQLGAKIEVVHGEDIPYQIAEFARLSGVSKIVIGRSAATRQHIFGKSSLTEKLIANASNLDVHIIPDTVSNASAYRIRKAKSRGEIIFSVSDIVKCILILAASSLIGTIFGNLGFAEANIITIYVLGVLVTSVVTKHRIYSLISAIVSVLVFNFLFTEPKFSFEAYGQGYPVTFVIMFLAAFLTGSLAARLKNQARQAAQSAYRTKVLFDTNQLLQQAKSREEIMSITSNQLIKLLDKDVVFYFAEDGQVKVPHVFTEHEEDFDDGCISEKEKSVAQWVLKNNKHAGASTSTFSNAKCLYLAIRVNSSVYGVVGIVVDEQMIDSFEKSILLSILGECALALENEKNAREKEEAAVFAKNEQLRANLLRAISHDLRTPLTSISGNASNLISNGEVFDKETKQRLYTDIYDDSMWLINLVENLLAVTRIEEGRINLRMSEDLVDDAVEEALNHVNRMSIEHNITVINKEEYLLARMDAKLIVQVIINIVDNAIKYTPKGSNIVIRTEKRGSKAVISIADDGAGIPDDAKPRIFDMFYCGANTIADSRRSMGLGLSLCKSIINAHGGEIRVEDNEPSGTIFTFTLPTGEVQIHE